MIPESTIAERVKQLLPRMTLAEKVGQMTQVENRSITPEGAAECLVGSVLSGGGGNPTPNTPVTWAQMVRRYQEAALRTRLGIPLLYGVDAVHGHSNLRGAVIFPHNVGLGASRDATLVERVARVTAVEVAATNVNWVFAPAVSVPQDIRWGRTYEGFGESGDLVGQLGVANLQGLQNHDGISDLGHPHSVLGSVKHYVGDGATTWGSNTTNAWVIDQGDAKVDEATLRAVHLAPYAAAINAGARNVMVSLSSWRNVRMHAHHYLLTTVLKEELGFSGFVVSDWAGVDYVHDNYHAAVVTSINAGVDMVMVPFDGHRFIEHLTRAVNNREVPMTRIDDAVGRVLRVKFELGLFEQPFGDESLLPMVGSEPHRAVAREAVSKSLVLLRNERHSLPLAKNTPCILVAGRAADDIGLQCGGWTIEWQGVPGAITPGTTILDGIKNIVSPDTAVRYDPAGAFPEDYTDADVGIVVLSEQTYAEGEGDREDLRLPAADVALLEQVRPRCERMVVILLSGRPLVVTDHLEAWDAFVAAWLPGTEGQGVADVLFGDEPFSGRLPYTWPRSAAQIPLSALAASGESPLFPYGYGLGQ